MISTSDPEQFTEDVEDQHKQVMESWVKIRDAIYRLDDGFRLQEMGLNALRNWLAFMFGKESMVTHRVMTEKLYNQLVSNKKSIGQENKNSMVDEFFGDKEAEKKEAAPSSTNESTNTSSQSQATSKGSGLGSLMEWFPEKENSPENETLPTSLSDQPKLNIEKTWAAHIKRQVQNGNHPIKSTLLPNRLSPKKTNIMAAPSPAGINPRTPSQKTPSSNNNQSDTESTVFSSPICPRKAMTEAAVSSYNRRSYTTKSQPIGDIKHRLNPNHGKSSKGRNFAVYLSNVPENANMNNIYGAIRAKIGKFKSVDCSFLTEGVYRLEVKKEATATQLLKESFEIFGIKIRVTEQRPTFELCNNTFIVYMSNIPPECTVKKLMGMVRRSVGEFTAMNKIVIEDGCCQITFENPRHQRNLLKTGLPGDLSMVRVSSKAQISGPVSRMPPLFEPLEQQQSEDQFECRSKRMLFWENIKLKKRVLDIREQILALKQRKMQLRRISNTIDPPKTNNVSYQDLLNSVNMNSSMTQASNIQAQALNAGKSFHPNVGNFDPRQANNFGRQQQMNNFGLQRGNNNMGNNFGMRNNIPQQFSGNNGPQMTPEAMHNFMPPNGGQRNNRQRDQQQMMFGGRRNNNNSNFFGNQRQNNNANQMANNIPPPEYLAMCLKNGGLRRNLMNNNGNNSRNQSQPPSNNIFQGQLTPSDQDMINKISSLRNNLGQDNCGNPFQLTNPFQLNEMHSSNGMNNREHFPVME